MDEGEEGEESGEDMESGSEKAKGEDGGGVIRRGLGGVEPIVPSAYSDSWRSVSSPVFKLGRSVA